MPKIDYFRIIHKYLKSDSAAYRFYLPHAILVTSKAIKIGAKLKLSSPKLDFIEEAAMLHDIGIINTDAKEIGCNGKMPYICHIVEGQKILEKEGLFKHALIARTHIGVGITKDEVVKNNLPLPPEDFIAKTIEEEIISYADLFFTKDPKLIWREKEYEKVVKGIEKHGKEKLKTLSNWRKKFGD
jgi:uncharacterized protein